MHFLIIKNIFLLIKSDVHPSLENRSFCSLQKIKFFVIPNNRSPTTTWNNRPAFFIRFANGQNSFLKEILFPSYLNYKFENNLNEIYILNGKRWRTIRAQVQTDEKSESRWEQWNLLLSTEIRHFKKWKHNILKIN